MSDEPRPVLILQARMGSTRLPGKTMLPLAGEPLLARILERVRRCRSVEELVVATTEQPEDDVVAALASEWGAGVFRGAEHDLVDRYWQAATAFAADPVVRLPADNPVPEPVEIDRVVEAHLAGDNAFTSNLAEVWGSGYPDGIGAEVISRRALESVWREVSDPLLREHPHLAFFDYETQTARDPQRYSVGTVRCPPEISRPDLVLDVNTPEEYRFIAELYNYLYPRDPEFGIADVIDWYENVHLPARRERS